MSISQKFLRIFPLLVIIIISVGLFFPLENEAEFSIDIASLQNPNSLPIIVDHNSLLSNSYNFIPTASPKRMKVIITAYSSTPFETDDTPFVTASGQIVRDGIVAANFLPFGTKIQIPELFGDKIFVVEDRMNPKKGYHVDIWFPSREKALRFGVHLSEILILP